MQKNPQVGIEYLIKGAAHNNAYCYYYLAMIYNEGVIVPKNQRLEFLYLKRAAEEGFVEMQHNLGLAYINGFITKRNDVLALAWLREAARNGYYPSYGVAGDILYEGTPPGLLPKEQEVQ